MSHNLFYKFVDKFDQKYSRFIFGIVARLGIDGHNGRAGGCPYPAETIAQRDERCYVVAGR